jgi:hypothetical protein
MTAALVPALIVGYPKEFTCHMQSIGLALMRTSGYNSLVKNCNHKGLGYISRKPELL